MRFSKRKLHFLFFSFLCWKIETEKRKKKQKRENSKKPYKNRVFLRWSSKNVKNQKKMDFSKNCLTLFVSGRETKNAHFRCNYLFWPKFFFGPKQCKAENTIKIGVSAEGGFTNCVFEKLCFPENTIFIVFSAKHSFFKNKNCMLKKKTENLWKIVGCFWTWKNGVFFGFVCCKVFMLKGLFLVCLVWFQKC